MMMDDEIANCQLAMAIHAFAFRDIKRRISQHQNHGMNFQNLGNFQTFLSFKENLETCLYLEAFAWT